MIVGWFNGLIYMCSFPVSISHRLSVSHCIVHSRTFKPPNENYFSWTHILSNNVNSKTNHSVANSFYTFGTWYWLFFLFLSASLTLAFVSFYFYCCRCCCCIVACWRWMRMFWRKPIRLTSKQFEQISKTEETFCSHDVRRAGKQVSESRKNETTKENLSREKKNRLSSCSVNTSIFLRRELCACTCYA